MNTASTNIAARKRVKTMRRVATHSLTLVLVCILAVANIAAGPFWGDSASADVSGFSKESSKLILPDEAATDLVYNGTRQQGYPNGVYPTAKYTGNGGNLEEYHSPFYVEYTGINGTRYGPLKASSARYQEINVNAPTNAGSYQVVFTVPDDAPFILLPNCLEFSIAKAPELILSPLSAPMIDAAGYQREFDLASMLNLPSDLGGGPAYSVTTHTENGLTAVSIDSKTDTLTLTSKGGAGLSTSDTVTVALKMGNYEDSIVQVNVGYTAKPDAMIGGVQAATGLVYDGDPQQGYIGTPQATYQVPANTSPDTYNGLFDLTYSGTTADGTAYGPTDQAPAAAGAYRVEFAVPDSAPVVATPLALDFSIGKAPLATVYTNAQLQPSGIATVDLASVLPGDMGSGPVYTVKSSTTESLAGASMDDASGMLTLTAKADALESAIDTVAVELSDMGNYENSMIEVTVRYERADGVVAGPATATGLVYNGNPQAGYTGAPSAVYTPAGTTDPISYDGPFDISYSGTTADGTAYGPTSTPPTAAGIYRATFALPQNAPCTGQPAVLDFAIDKASLVFHAENASMTAGDAVPKLGYNVSGLQGSDRVTREPLLTVVGDTASAGSCTIAISGAAVDNQACYNVSYASGTLTVSAAPQPEPKPEPKPEPTPEPTPEPVKPEVKPLTPAAKSEAKLATPASKTLASTGDAALPGFVLVAVLAAALAALAVGASFALSKRPSRQRLHSDSKRK
ncbi:MBG domain-containing protein [Eggerthella guodeyinii]|uniref:MBG domain-containing protein n=1 Tax=Eggerthella guodeyinii TaxID=2690837 RepID=UPI0018A2199E|nr:MBG domain-containing protein [Eggerthella guodeyinii]